MGSSGKVPNFYALMIFPVSWHGKTGWHLIESSLSQATVSFAAMAVVAFSLPRFCADLSLNFQLGKLDVSKSSESK